MSKVDKYVALIPRIQSVLSGETDEIARIFASLIVNDVFFRMKLCILYELNPHICSFNSIIDNYFLRQEPGKTSDIGASSSRGSAWQH